MENKCYRNFESGFEFCTTPKIILQPGGCSQLGALCNKFHASSVVLITDPTIKKLGLIENTIDSLAAAGLNVNIFSDVTQILQTIRYCRQ